MANIAIIIAGGSGHRMGQDIPKQFINVYDKPVLIYTLESFQKHPQIDAIEVVCLDGWHGAAESSSGYPELCHQGRCHRPVQCGNH